MTQSVELLLDPAAERVIRGQWADLADAGLPSEQRSNAHSSHRPHITLYAANTLDPEAELRIADLVDGLDLTLTIGATMIFGPRRGSCIVVRQVVTTEGLAQLQSAVVTACTDEPDAHFRPGQWTPHVTVAHRVPTERLRDVVAVLGEAPITTHIRSVRRWDSDQRRTWLVT